MDVPACGLLGEVEQSLREEADGAGQPCGQPRDVGGWTGQLWC